MSAHSRLSIVPDAEQTCNLTYIKRRLGRQGWGDQRTATYLRSLIADYHFPRPFPSMRAKMGKLVDDIVPDSVWQRLAVDHWFDDRLPPAVAAKRGDDDLRAAAADMDAMAGQLGQVLNFGARP